MSIFTALAIYFVIWWIALFLVLPWGVRSQDESGEVTPGTDPGAPVLTNLRRKLVWTTIVATVSTNRIGAVRRSCTTRVINLWRPEVGIDASEIDNEITTATV